MCVILRVLGCESRVEKSVRKVLLLWGAGGLNKCKRNKGEAC